MTTKSNRQKTTTTRERAQLEDDPLWYQDAVIYELPVRAYCDSDGDGIGDFRGLIEKLDYLQDLGVTALWLLPFYPSPLRDDGYDIAEYTQVHSDYGTLRDFRSFVREAHKRGMRVITELVVNHTSDQHPWFQRSRKAGPGTKWGDFYVWSDTTDRYSDTRIIFRDFEHSNWTWDERAQAYFWHRFYSHQPDLNYDNPDVHKAIFKVLDQWMDYGVDGFRLDAVPYLYEREGTDCENLPETHAFLKLLRKHIDDNYENRMMLAEANQWPEYAAAYFGEGDECHMNFHFPLMPRMFMSLRLEDRSPIIDILEQTPDLPGNCQWATFLRNHDELTLEMVTDEERDYMYRVYAKDPRMRINLGIRRRLAPLLGNNRRSIELLNSLLFSLSGTPVIYYGDEIGMGDNIFLGDRNGVRTPMQWSADRNAGFSSTNPQQLYLPVIIDPEYHYQSVNVEAQQNNPSSLLWWMKRLIALRKQYRAFSRGTLEFLHPENRKVLVFLRRYEDECVLVVANLSRFSQYVEVDLSEFRGRVPMEVFGHTEFPPIGDLPYLLTLAPHTFYWFDLHEAPVGAELHTVAADDGRPEPQLAVRGAWSRILGPRSKQRLTELLPAYLNRCRWFGGKGRRIVDVDIARTFPLDDKETMIVALLTVQYRDGEPERYQLPLSFAADEDQEEFVRWLPSQAVVAHMKTDEGTGVLYDAVYNPAYGPAHFELLNKRRKIDAQDTHLIGKSSAEARAFRKEHSEPSYTLVRAEQSNSSVIVGDRFMLKIFRRLYDGVNPDLEIGRYLTDRTAFPNIPPVHGSLELSQKRADTITLAMLQEFVPNEGDAWSYTTDQAAHFLGDVQARMTAEDTPPLRGEDPASIPVDLRELIGAYLVFARLLGKRTGEMHRALAADPEAPGFAPEPFTPFYRRSLYQSMRNQLSATCTELRKQSDPPAHLGAMVKRVLAQEKKINDFYKKVTDQELDAQRIRIHGDYHLGQVLQTASDVIIIDFEGEPARSITERRLTRSPLRDIAGMLRSFQYAPYFYLHEELEHGVVREEDIPYLRQWADYWVGEVSDAFLGEYRDTTEGAAFLPADEQQFQALLRALLLDKALYEVRYELNNRPAWLDIPLRGILQLLEDA